MIELRLSEAHVDLGYDKVGARSTYKRCIFSTYYLPLLSTHILNLAREFSIMERLQAGWRVVCPSYQYKRREVRGSQKLLHLIFHIP